MPSRLPDFVDPRRMADLEKVFSGCAAIVDLPRLAEVVLDADGGVELRLVFNREGGKRISITGFVRADLILECQRCLSPMAASVESQLNIALVNSAEEAERLPEHYDPLLLDEPRIRLLDIVEDELLLSLPQVPRHKEGECCSAVSQKAVQPAADFKGSDNRPNPFAVLSELKQR